MNCVQDYIANPSLRSKDPAIIFFDGIKSLNNSKNITSFDQLYQKSILAQLLLKKYGLKNQDTILLFEKPTSDLYALILAALGLGIKILIVEPWMSAENFNLIARKARPKAIFTNLVGSLILKKSKSMSEIKNVIHSKELNQLKLSSEEFIVEDVDKSHDAIITFTSGSSGTPKSVTRNHEFLINQRNVLKKHLKYNDLDKLDLTVFTNLTLLNLVLGKGSLIFNTKWKKRSIADLDDIPQKYMPDTVSCGPKFLELLLDNTKTLSLSGVNVGGALGDVGLYERAIQRWQSAEFLHVYGSTEAEPVAISDLKLAVKKSNEKGCFQNLYLGDAIEQVNYQFRNDALWVSGPHVSPMYEGDAISNSLNKWIDDNGTLWHNMGDRVHVDDGLWYEGRDFQTKEEFDSEQRAYSLLGHSSAFVEKQDIGLVLYGENVETEKLRIQKTMPRIVDVINRKIIRDPRHRARIDRKNTHKKGVPMNNIMIFIKERLPIVANLILTCGFLFSTLAINNTNNTLGTITFGGFCLFLFMTELRFMDELKDYDKDIVAHPDRPLPRGIVTPHQVGKLIKICFSLLMLCTVVSWKLYGTAVGVMSLVAHVWLLLMYKEFYLPGKLDQYPLLYAISHQVVIVPLCFFSIGLMTDLPILSSEAIGFSLLVLGSFFAFEVGRKMDPGAHKILGTYLIHYGKTKTNILITFLCMISLVGAYMLSVFWWVFIPFVLVIATQLRVMRNEKIFKDLEGIVSLNLIYNVWVIYIASWF